MSVGYFEGGVAKHRVEAAWFIFIAVAVLAGGARWFSTAAASADTAPGVPAGLLVAVLALLAAAAYVPALRIGLLSDDFVLADRALRHDFFSVSSSGFFRPVPLIVWAALLLPGVPVGAVGIHLLNIGLHVVNARLVQRLARRVGLSTDGALLAAIVFLCFPAGVEAVAWSSGIQDVLLTTATLAFVLAATAARTAMNVTIAALAFIVALGTKETAVAAPVLALLIAIRRRPQWQAALVPIATLVVAAAYATWRVATAPAGAGPIVPSRYAAKQMISVAFSSLAVPITSGEIASHPALGIAAALLIIGLVAGAVLRAAGNRAEFPAALRGAAWALVAILPVNALFFVDHNLQGSRYLYLPACGWAMLVAALATALPIGRRVVAGTAAMVAVVGIADIHLHLVDWQIAARTRDVVLAAARAALDAQPCRPVAFAEIPDSSGGAYVLRNGFVEAMTLSGVPPGSAIVGHAGGACTVTWDGIGFR